MLLPLHTGGVKVPSSCAHGLGLGWHGHTACVQVMLQAAGSTHKTDLCSGLCHFDKSLVSASLERELALAVPFLLPSCCPRSLPSANAAGWRRQMPCMAAARRLPDTTAWQPWAAQAAQGCAPYAALASTLGCAASMAHAVPRPDLC